MSSTPGASEQQSEQEDASTNPPLPDDLPESPPPGTPPVDWAGPLKARCSAALRDPRVATAVGILGVVVAIVALQPVIKDVTAEGVKVNPIKYSASQITSPSYVIPRHIEEIMRPPGLSQENIDWEAEFEAWTERYGAVRANNTVIYFTATSDQAEATIITEVRVEVVRREPPLEGTWIAPHGGGPMDVRAMVADLDADPPVATIYNSSFAFPLKVSDADPEIFSLSVDAKTCHCFWQIEMDILDDDGATRTLTVNDDGKPFEITGSGNTSYETLMPSREDDPWPIPRFN